MNRQEYREVYLRSPHWLETRSQALVRAGHRCQVCNSANHLDVHHRTYENLGHEKPGDLTVLCRSCHDLFHASRAVTNVTPIRRSKPKTKKAKRPKVHRSVLDIICPHCGSGTKKACVSPRGLPIKAHRQRHAIARQPEPTLRESMAAMKQRNAA